MSDLKNVNGHLYPAFDGRWGGFAEELFHHTSRYYVATEAFLRNLSQDRGFAMGGYRAAMLSIAQRDLMAAVLSCRPDRQSATAVASIVTAVISRSPGVEARWVEIYRGRLNGAARHEALVEGAHAVEHDAAHTAPLDPFLNIAERLQIPVAVRDYHVEVSLHDLAEHLDSPSSALRTSLLNAVLRLHAAGYVLRNHPHLTHAQAQEIGDLDSV